MDTRPYAIEYDDLPSEIAIFPLRGALLLPYGRLPLNIFEPRYVAMIEDALAGSRMIGMIQPDESGDENALYTTGCAGKIIEFNETDDGRFLITLIGISRFLIRKELKERKGYRVVRPNWAKFSDDLGPQTCRDIDREKLEEMLKAFFKLHELHCDWEMVEQVPDSKLITCLSTVCPFSPQEKQVLLEAPCCSTRAEKFMTILEMAVCGNKGGCC